MARKVKIDSIDLKLLAPLQADGRIKLSHLAARLDLPESTVRDRIDRLTNRGVLVGYTTVLSAEPCGVLDQVLTLQIKAPHPAALLAFEAAASACEQIASVKRMIGHGRYMVRGLGAGLSQTLAAIAYTAGVTIEETRPDAIALELKPLRGAPLQALLVAD